MVMDVAIGRIDPDLDQGMAMGHFTTGAVVRREQEKSQEREAPENPQPGRSKMLIAKSSHFPRRYVVDAQGPAAHWAEDRSSGQAYHGAVGPHSLPPNGRTPSPAGAESGGL